MAKNIDGPLYYERMGRAGPVIACPPEPDVTVVLDFSDGALVDLVPLHCHRHPGIRSSAQGQPSSGLLEAIDPATLFGGIASYMSQGGELSGAIRTKNYASTTSLGKTKS